MKPDTEQQLATLVANANGPVQINGGGTRPIGRPVQGDHLTTSGLSGITLYDPGALTIVAQAGTPVADIDAALKAQNQRLAFEPMDHRALLGTNGTPTIGGVAAGNISGPRRIAVGACRDFLLGVRFVDGMGQIVKNGGRVMKNVTGYDLVKLMAGSYGTLGIMTEVALKVLPDVESTATLTLSGLDDVTAIKAMSKALGSPFDITGAAHTADGQTTLRIEGFKGSVAYRAAQLQSHLNTFGSVAVDFDDTTTWDAIRDVTAFADATGDVWRISTRPSLAAALAAKTNAIKLQYDWGGGLIWALVREGHDIRQNLGDFEGHATLVRASQSTREKVTPFQPEPAPLAAISNGLRAKFDPRGILNPGLMN